MGYDQLLWLFILSIPIACISWTVTHEEIFKEPRDFCIDKSQNCGKLYQRKFFYLFTCEYCFSHYVTLFFVIMTNYKLLVDNWFGYVIAEFALVFMANVYMSLFALLRQEIKKEKAVIVQIEKEIKEKSESDI